MQMLLNTIMLEPNRWTGDHILSWPLIDLLKPVAEAGFGELEIWQYHISRLHRQELDALRERLDELRLGSVAIGGYPKFHLTGGEGEAMEAELDRLVEYGVVLGVDLFKIFPGSLGSEKLDEAQRELSVNRILRLAEQLAMRDIVLTMETHGNTLCDTLESTLRLLEELSACGDRVGICFQPYIEHDTDQAIATFDALDGRVRHLHLQNRREGGTTLLEEGDWTDYSRFLPHVRERGFGGPLSLEFTDGITPAEGESFDLRRVIDNAARDRDFACRAWDGAA